MAVIENNGFLMFFGRRIFCCRPSGISATSAAVKTSAAPPPLSGGGGIILNSRIGCLRRSLFALFRVVGFGFRGCGRNYRCFVFFDNRFGALNLKVRRAFNGIVGTDDNLKPVFCSSSVKVLRLWFRR